MKKKVNLGVLIESLCFKGVPRSWLDPRFNICFFNSVDGCYVFGIVGYKVIFISK